MHVCSDYLGERKILEYERIDISEDIDLINLLARVTVLHSTISIFLELILDFSQNYETVFTMSYKNL